MELQLGQPGRGGGVGGDLGGDGILSSSLVAIDETVILLHPPLPLAGVSIVMERERQQIDSLVNGYSLGKCGFILLCSPQWIGWPNEGWRGQQQNHDLTSWLSGLIFPAEIGAALNAVSHLPTRTGRQLSFCCPTLRDLFAEGRAVQRLVVATGTASACCSISARRLSSSISRVGLRLLPDVDDVRFRWRASDQGSEGVRIGELVEVVESRADSKPAACVEAGGPFGARMLMRAS